MLTAIFGFMKTIVTKTITWIVGKVRGIIVDTVIGNVFNN